MTCGNHKLMVMPAVHPGFTLLILVYISPGQLSGSFSPFSFWLQLMTFGRKYEIRERRWLHTVHWNFALIFVNCSRNWQYKNFWVCWGILTNLYRPIRTIRLYTFLFSNRFISFIDETTTYTNYQEGGRSQQSAAR